MDEEEKKTVEIASYFDSICCTPWFLKFYLSQANSLEAMKKSFSVSGSYLNLGQSFILGMQRYAPVHLTQ